MFILSKNWVLDLLILCIVFFFHFVDFYSDSYYFCHPLGLDLVYSCFPNSLSCITKPFIMLFLILVEALKAINSPCGLPSVCPRGLCCVVFSFSFSAGKFSLLISYLIHSSFNNKMFNRLKLACLPEVYLLSILSFCALWSYRIQGNILFF